MIQQYRHYKGNLYTLFDVGRCREENEFYAIYKRSDHPSTAEWGWCRHSENLDVYFVDHNGEIDGRQKYEELPEGIRKSVDESGLWIRPLEMFFGYHESGVRRFERVMQ